MMVVLNNGIYELKVKITVSLQHLRLLHAFEDKKGVKGAFYTQLGYYQQYSLLLYLYLTLSLAAKSCDVTVFKIIIIIIIISLLLMVVHTYMMGTDGYTCVL